MYFKYIATVVAVVFILAGCTAALYMPGESDAVKYNISLDTLKAGRELYVKHCGSCHNLYLPENYTKQEWKEIMDIMQEPAKIDDHQKRLISKYLEIHSKI